MDTPKRPRDLNQLAASIVRAVTSEDSSSDTSSSLSGPPNLSEPEKDPAAVSLGRRGGLKGGKARAAKLTSKRKSEIARNAARARWNKAK
jgi:hypothetical protein